MVRPGRSVSYNKSGCGDAQPSRIAIRGSRLSPRDDKRIHPGLVANGTCGDNHQPHDDRPPNRQSADLDLNTLRAELATYPCCTTNSNSTREGDPLYAFGRREDFALQKRDLQSTSVSMQGYG